MTLNINKTMFSYSSVQLTLWSVLGPTHLYVGLISNL